MPKRTIPCELTPKNHEGLLFELEALIDLKLRPEIQKAKGLNKMASRRLRKYLMEFEKLARIYRIMSSRMFSYTAKKLK